MKTSRARTRAPEASVSLEAATDAGRRARTSRPDVSAPRLGLTRNEALDLVLASAQEAGANAAYARVLRGAADLFGRVAIDEVSVETILEAASVSRRTFYQFFESKAAVLDALLAVVGAMWVASAQKAVARTPTYDALLGAHIDAFRLGGFLLEVLIAEATAPGSKLRGRFEWLLTSLTEVHGTLVGGVTPVLRARTVATIAVLLDSGVDPETDATESDEVRALLRSLFAT